jgi:hypothetical protein
MRPTGGPYARVCDEFLLWVSIAAVLPQAEAHEPSPLSRDEAMALYSRSYTGKDDKAVFEAIRQLFLLADVPRDLAIEYPDARTMVVTREGGGFPMPLRFNWRFDVERGLEAGFHPGLRLEAAQLGERGFMRAGTRMRH